MGKINKGSYLEVESYPKDEKINVGVIATASFLIGFIIGGILG